MNCTVILKAKRQESAILTNEDKFRSIVGLDFHLFSFLYIIIINVITITPRKSSLYRFFYHHRYYYYYYYYFDYYYYYYYTIVQATRLFVQTKSRGILRHAPLLLIMFLYMFRNTF